MSFYRFLKTMIVYVKQEKDRIFGISLSLTNYVLEKSNNYLILFNAKCFLQQKYLP